MPGIYQSRRRERQIQESEARGQGAANMLSISYQQKNPAWIVNPVNLASSHKISNTPTPPRLPLGEVCRECFWDGYPRESHQCMSRRKGPGGKEKGGKFRAWHMEESVGKQGWRGSQGPDPVQSCTSFSECHLFCAEWEWGLFGVKQVNNRNSTTFQRRSKYQLHGGWFGKQKRSQSGGWCDNPSRGGGGWRQRRPMGDCSGRLDTPYLDLLLTLSCISPLYCLPRRYSTSCTVLGLLTSLGAPGSRCWVFSGISNLHLGQSFVLKSL